MAVNPDTRYSVLRTPRFALILLALACALAVLAASWRHTGSLAFPIDDGYIYSNYALSGAQGHPFTYNSGETSGGITGLGWYLLCIVSYWLLAPLHGLLGGLAPAEVQAAGSGLAHEAGHLYLAAYLPGVICLAFTAVGVYRLAQLALPLTVRNNRVRESFCLLLGAIAAADLGLVWGALSGLEVALSSALVVWAVVLLVSDLQKGYPRWSLLVFAILPWARPDLLAISAGCVVWLLARVLTSPRDQRASALKHTLLFAGASVVGFVALSAIYLVGWGRLLPSSFYAKVGGLRSGAKMLSAVQEIILAGRALPFVWAGSALLGGLVGLLPSPRRSEYTQAGGERNESRWVAILLLMCSIFYVLALLITLPWFGQEDRYLLPLHPFLIVLLGLLVWRVLDLLSLERVFAVPAVRPLLLAIGFVLLVGVNYLWATRDYVVEVRNIRDAHIIPALWIAANTPPDSVIASEPIGAVRLFSGRRTVDLVGLTTPATLGTYRDWSRAWPALRSAGATFLFFYPAWFDGGVPPAWAVEAQRFAIPDNRIAGSDPIAVYKLDWSLFSGAP